MPRARFVTTCQVRAAKAVLAQGPGVLKAKRFEILSDWSDTAHAMNPADVDWQAAADGKIDLRVRQLPGPGNAMGRMKFMFPNDKGVYLHDTPEKALFAKEERNLSAGCIRLSDAPRFARWLLQGQTASASGEPEQHVALPGPVPVYVTYLTAHATPGGQIAFVDDVYGLDSNRGTAVAGLR